MQLQSSLDEKPRISGDLESVGFYATLIEPDIEAFLGVSKEVGALIGAKHFGFKVLESSGSNASLPVHAENIYHNNPGLPGYFALGCIAKATRGGATTLHDARKAAETIQNTAPELANIKVGYSSTNYPGSLGIYALIYNSPDYGAVMRFREKVETNYLIDKLPKGMSEDKFYRIVQEAIGNSLVAEHEWEPGDYLVVNNSLMLHGRQPFEGHRKLVRIRFDDPNHSVVEI